MKRVERPAVELKPIRALALDAETIETESPKVNPIPSPYTPLAGGAIVAKLRTSMRRLPA